MPLFICIQNHRWSHLIFSPFMTQYIAFLDPHTAVKFVPCSSVYTLGISHLYILEHNTSSLWNKLFLLLPIWDLDIFPESCQMPPSMSPSSVLQLGLSLSCFSVSSVFGVDLCYSLRQPSSVLVVCWVLWVLLLAYEFLEGRDYVLFIFGHRACYAVKTESRSS